MSYHLVFRQWSMCLVILLMSIFVLNSSCTGAHKKKDFEKSLSVGACDQALTKLPENDPLVKLSAHSQLAAGTVLSYAFVGASYTAEVLIDVVGGAVMVVALCGPMLAATVASPGAGGPLTCLPGKLNALQAPPLGRHANRQTEHLRCPDLKSLSQSLRAVAHCYQAQAGEENLATAIKTLSALKRSSDFYACMPQDERILVEQQLITLGTKPD